MLPRPAESLKNGAGFSGKTEPTERKRVVSMPQSEQLARTLKPLLSKGKGTEPSVQITGLCGGRALK